MTWVVWLRLLKMLAVLAFAAGTIGVFMPGLALEQRRAFAYRLAGPAFGAVWMLGFTVAGVSEIPLSSTFILGALFCSFVSINAVLYAAGAESRATPRSAAVGIGGLVASVVFMVLRP